LVNLALTVRNTTAETPGATTSKLVAFGFDFPAISANYTSPIGSFRVFFGQSLSPFNGTFDTIYSVGNGLNVDDPGLSTNGLSAGESQLFSIDLFTTDNPDQVEAAFLAILGQNSFASSADYENSCSVVRFREIGPNNASDQVSGLLTLTPQNPPPGGGTENPPPGGTGGSNPPPTGEAIPEPGTIAGIGMATVAGWLTRRRKKLL